MKLKLLAKILITILLSGITWFFEWAAIYAMNMPNTAMVVLGFAGVVSALFFWCAEMNWLWDIDARARLLYEKIKREIA